MSDSHDETTALATTRFVLLWHDCPDDYRDGPHWDLMIERPGVSDEHRLATWSLLRLPREWALAVGRPDVAIDGPNLPAMRLPDHRARYLNYEGPIGGGRGSVRREARGEAAWLSSGDAPLDVVLDGAAPWRGRLREPTGTPPEILFWA